MIKTQKKGNIKFSLKIDENITEQDFLEGIFNYYYQGDNNLALFFLGMWALGGRMKADKLIYYIKLLEGEKYE